MINNIYVIIVFKYTVRKKNHAIDLYIACKEKECFGRSVVEEVTVNLCQGKVRENIDFIVRYKNERIQ